MVIGIAALQHWEMFAVNSKLKAVAKVSATKHITGASLNPLGAREWAGNVEGDVLMDTVEEHRTQKGTHFFGNTGQ